MIIGCKNAVEYKIVMLKLEMKIELLRSIVIVAQQKSRACVSSLMMRPRDQFSLINKTPSSVHTFPQRLEGEVNYILT